MKTIIAAAIASLTCLLCAGGIAWTQAIPEDARQPEPTQIMTQHASGTFDVKITPQKADNPVAERGKHGRMSIDKHYHGELEGDGAGEMLSAMATKDSGVYVAVERVTATLQGRKGSFLLHHTGLMNRGAQSLKISVVPDSGEGELKGISGTMNIKIEKGQHFYELEYELVSE
jgi:Protein of unknown function (DUF3224)